MYFSNYLYEGVQKFKSKSIDGVRLHKLINGLGKEFRHHKKGLLGVWRNCVNAISRNLSFLSVQNCLQLYLSLKTQTLCLKVWLEILCSALVRVSICALFLLFSLKVLNVTFENKVLWIQKEL